LSFLFPARDKGEDNMYQWIIYGNFEKNITSLQSCLNLFKQEEQYMTFFCERCRQGFLPLSGTMILLRSVYQRFPKQEDCYRHLEFIRWSNQPVCPYCHSARHSRMPLEHRYHCNNCNKSYSVTVNTVFHKSKIDLQKWFFAFMLLRQSEEEISCRKLAEVLDINKNAAWHMLSRMKTALEQGFYL